MRSSPAIPTPKAPPTPTTRATAAGGGNNLSTQFASIFGKATAPVAAASTNKRKLIGGAT